jgi:serine/threonine protein kinase
MNFLSSANIVHRDLKPANILMNKKCQVKICDFGLARTLPEPTRVRSLSAHVSSRWYRAPEIIATQTQYHQAVDIWSVGCIAFELIKFKEISKSADPKKETGSLSLFPGDHCEPLTPREENVTDKNGND